MVMDLGLYSAKLVQCRICHDEDEQSKMETPCACRGSLKYAHRGCVQKWCFEKGDIVCEICQQQFTPGYSTPPPWLHSGLSPVRLREIWEIPRRNLRNHHPVSIVAAEGNLFEPHIDEYLPPTSSVICCRIIVIIFMVLLVLRHTLPVVLNGAGEYSFTLYMLLMLRTMGLLLTIIVISKTCTVIYHRRHRQIFDALHATTSDVENEIPRTLVRGHLIR